MTVEYSKGRESAPYLPCRAVETVNLREGTRQEVGPETTTPLQIVPKVVVAIPHLDRASGKIALLDWFMAIASGPPLLSSRALPSHQTESELRIPRYALHHGRGTVAHTFLFR